MGGASAADMNLAEMVGDVIPEVILVVGGIAILCYALFAPRRLQLGAAFMAIVTATLAAVATVLMMDGPEYLTFSDTYARDGTAFWATLIVLVATVAVVGLSVPWFRRDPRHGEYYTLLLFSALGAILLAGAADLKQFVVALLLSSVTGFVLVAYHRRSSPAAEAAIKYYLLGAFTNAAMLVGVAYLFGLAGSTTLSGLAELPAADGFADRLLLGIALVLVIVALAFKIGAVPVHAWMPDVAQGAPAPVAAFVTTVPKVGGFIFLARLLLSLPAETVDWRLLAALLATATMTLGNLAALWQDDVRRLLGWSAVSQTGYGLLAIAALGRSDLAVPALLFFLLAYAVGNMTAFGVVVELRGRTRLEEYAGLARARPGLAAALAIAFLSFIGVPPLAGFFAKLVLLGAAIEAGFTWLAVVAAINTVISIVYYVRVLAPVYFGNAGGPVPVLGKWAAVATSVATVAIVVVGVAAEPFIRAFEGAGLLPG